MIVFDLRCSHKHSFEGWFKDIESFNDQRSRGMITCPVCKDTDITKVLSPVAIKSNQREKRIGNAELDYAQFANDMLEHINNNFDDVGTDFAKEALKMHYGVEKKRNIRGSATAKEEEALIKDDIKFFKVPPLSLDKK